MTSQHRRPSSARGRPTVTSHAAIEQAAFRLFAERGFAGTTMEAIAAELGVSKRTLFRYYDSKNDIPWGQFDQTLDGFRAILDEMPHDLPVHEAVHCGVVRFNEFPDDASPSHRERMRLILTTPELQAHSVLRYAQWRQVIVEYVARRTGADPADVLPRTMGHVALALALTGYETWLDDPEADLTELLREATGALREALGGDGTRPADK